MASCTNNTYFWFLFIPPDLSVEATTSPHPIITGVPSFNIVSLEAFAVT